MMHLVTSATGQKHREAALKLSESLAAHGWSSSLYILSDAPVNAPNNIVRDSTMPGGRDLKCGFASYIDVLPPEQPVAWIDADCLAIGPEPVWDALPDKSVAGFAWLQWGAGRVFLADQLKTRLSFDAGTNVGFFSSFFLQFDSARTARAVCGEWPTNLIEDLKWQNAASLTDEIALLNTLQSLSVRQINLSQAARHSDGKYAYSTLWHPPHHR